jgi:uncharacterized protein YyaL (SSP411 family)
MNQLHLETSPYLLQHKDNPVHWRAWSDAAFAEAKAQNRPILLSVGYAACHWCHVMAHESFENPEIAALMNAHFIPVKVDREERPDIDLIYQQALAITGQHGGWPLTMFLTPEGDAFWGGTYFPPFANFGRPGFADVLTGVAQHWQDSQGKVRENADQLKASLRSLSRLGSSGERLDLSPDFLDRAAAQLAQDIDPEFGGFLGAPKFPQIPSLLFLWRAWRRGGSGIYRRAVTKTLDAMIKGGIHDHAGGGFARYATDARWLVPHFEKMLYDNAQILELLALVWPEEKKLPYLMAAEGIVEWLIREMKGQAGGLCASLDADSEGEEGLYYTWTMQEIEDALGQLAPSFIDAHGVTPDGNWENGRNILHRLKAGPDWDDSFAPDLKLLLKARQARVPPLRDDKILADWNGLAIAALARAGWVFDRADWVSAARDIYRFVLANLSREDRLYHSWCQGKPGALGVLDDYAQMIRAALAIHEITGEAAFLSHAKVWAEAAIRHHWDEAEGGFFLTAEDAVDLPVRAKPFHDNATPSGNGVMAENLARLYHLTGESRWLERAEATLRAFGGAYPRQYPGMTGLLGAFEHLNGALLVTVHGPLHGEETYALISQILELSLPDRIFHMIEAEGPVFATVCRGQACSPPLRDAASLRAELLSGYATL